MVQMPFRRKNNQSNVPKEISDYYQAERKQRMGTAWMLSIVAFVVTVALVLGIFFGGRWIYRQFKNDDQGKPTETAQTNESQEQKSEGNTSQTESREDSTSNQETPSPSSSQDQTSDSQRESTNSSQSAQTPSTSNETTTQAPVTGDTVPNTGPGEVLMVFGVTTLLATVTHNLYLRKRATK